MTEKQKVTPDALRALFNAVDRNSLPDLVQWVFKYGAENIDQCPDGYNRSALLEACADGRTAAALFLIGAGANPDHAGSNGMTPLHAAATGDRAEIAEALLSKGADIEKTWGEHTPLQQAVSFGSERVTRVLLKHGADVTRCTQKGESILDLIFADEQDGIRTAVKGEVSRVFGAETARVCKEGTVEAVQPLKKIKLKAKPPAQS